jgi:hypothetical protein
MPTAKANKLWTAVFRAARSKVKFVIWISRRKRDLTIGIDKQCYTHSLE